MREIKFRAWDKTYKKMYSQQDFPIIEWVKNQPKYLHLEGTKFSDNFELMQFTGLKDKNGKEIFEGDIVRYELSKFLVEEPALSHGVAVIEWIKEDASFAVQTHEDEIFTIGRTKEIEVIGNKFEHKELLTSIV